MRQSRSTGASKPTPKQRKSQLLSAKRQKFVDAFMGKAEQNATKAAKIAGYKNPKQQGSRLLTFVDVRQEMARRLKISEKSSIMSMERRKERLSELGEDAEKDNDSIKAIDTLNKMDGLYIQKHEFNLPLEQTETAVIAMYKDNPDLWVAIKKGVEG